jgi:hypothetical protein
MSDYKNSAFYKWGLGIENRLDSLEHRAFILMLVSLSALVLSIIAIVS